jgi:hypothetical protein
MNASNFFETLIFATGDVSSKGSAAEICSADDAYFFRTASTVAVLGSMSPLPLPSRFGSPKEVSGSPDRLAHLC